MLFNLFGRKPAPTPAPMPLIFSSLAPRAHTATLVEGDPTHEHTMLEVPWEEKEFGPQTTFDKDHGSSLEFPMCTEQTMYKCACGRQVVRKERSLI